MKFPDGNGPNTRIAISELSIGVFSVNDWPGSRADVPSCSFVGWLPGT